MARQLVFASNIGPTMILPEVCADKWMARGRPYRDTRYYAGREFPFLFRDGNSKAPVVVLESGESLVYDETTGDVIVPRTQDLDESPASFFFAKLEMIARIERGSLSLDLSRLLFDFVEYRGDLLVEQQEAWAQELRRYQRGDMDPMIRYYKDQFR